MIQSKQKVADLCDRLMHVNPSQIIIDLVQEDIEEIVNASEVTPDDIGAIAYRCGILLEIYNPDLIGDVNYLTGLLAAIDDWQNDAMFANKVLGLDPNN